MTQDRVVAHVVHSLSIGGLENGVVNLVNDDTPGLRHVIVCMSDGAALRQRLHPRVAVYHLNKRPGHDPRTFFNLVRRLRAIKPSIVHSRNWAAFDAVVAAPLAGVRTIIHGEHGRDIADPDGRNARRNRLRRVCGPLVSRFVAVSEDLRRWLVDIVRLPPAKVLTIHNGVDTACFVPGDRAAARQDLGLRLDAPILGTVGRLDPVKDHVGLVRAFSRVRQTHPHTVLVITGDGPCRTDIHQLVASLGLDAHVVLLGERHDVPRVLRAMDIFVLSSIAEGMSNTVLEAMATGLPIVATSVGGTPELVAEGLNGILVPPRNPAALATALETYLSDRPRLDLHGRSSRQHAVDHFDLHRMRDAYTNLYTSITRRAAA